MSDEPGEVWEPTPIPDALSQARVDMEASRPYHVADCSKEKKTGRCIIIIKAYVSTQVRRAYMQWTPDEPLLAKNHDEHLRQRWRKMVLDMDDGLAAEERT